MIGTMVAVALTGLLVGVLLAVAVYAVWQVRALQRRVEAAEGLFEDLPTGEDGSTLRQLTKAIDAHSTKLRDLEDRQSKFEVALRMRG